MHNTCKDQVQGRWANSFLELPGRIFEDSIFINKTKLRLSASFSWTINFKSADPAKNVDSFMAFEFSGKSKAIIFIR